MRIAHSRSFSETGRAENVSQPALSRTIRLLEEQLGARLFDRNSRNVSLTSAGEAMLPMVERLIADFDHAFSELALTFSGARGRVVIGAIPSAAASLLPKAIASFLQNHPHVEIILRDYVSSVLYQEMQDRQIDLAITTPPDAPGFLFEPFTEDAMMLVARTGTFEESGEIDWSCFVETPFIAMAPRSSVRELTDSAMRKAGINVRPLFEATQLSTVRALIEAGLGVTALPESAITLIESPLITVRPLVNPLITVKIGISHLADRTLAPAAEAFRRHFLAGASTASW